MKRSSILVLFLGLIAGRTAMAQGTICAGAEGGSTACAAPCSGEVVNDNVRPDQENLGKFNVGYANQGDGNDGFSNSGSFNIGSGNLGNCNLGSGLNVGSCDVDNNNGRIVLRFCNIYPSDPKCLPSGYLAEFTDDLKNAIGQVVGSCAGGPPLEPLPPVAETPEMPPMDFSPASEPTKEDKHSKDHHMKGMPPAMPPSTPAPGEMPSDMMPEISDSKADPKTLLKLFAEHLKQEKAAGRKLRL